MSTSFWAELPPLGVLAGTAAQEVSSGPAEEATRLSRRRGVLATLAEEAVVAEPAHIGSLPRAPKTTGGF